MEAGKVQMKKKSKKSPQSIWVSSLTPAHRLPPFIIQVSTLRSLGESEAGAGSQNQDGMGHTVTGFLSGSAYKSGFSAELGCVTYKCLIYNLARWLQTFRGQLHLRLTTQLQVHREPHCAKQI